jgi:hypothetical protein
MKKILIVTSCLVMSVITSGQRTDAQMAKQAQSDYSQLAPPLQTATERQMEVENTLERAQKGDVQAMYDMGMNYAKGYGVNRDTEKAFSWFQHSAEAGLGAGWTEMGRFYKNGTGRAIDYNMAYAYYSKGAAMNHAQGTYMKAYMQYKGFGCNQSYNEAVRTIRKGISLNSLGCMYMLGVCYRNGFGVEMNADSALFWLNKSAKAGFDLASLELRTPTPEYNPGAAEMVERVGKAQKIAQKVDYPLNRFSKIENQLHQEEVNGIFNGYLLLYDWSGAKITEASPVTLDLSLKDGQISGTWKEEGIDESLTLKGVCTADKVIFKDVNFRRPNHYHEEAPLTYNFKEASLQLIKHDGQLILSGNLALYVPSMKEPQQPAQLILMKKATDRDVLDTGSGLISNMSVYPNPFDQQLSVEFTIAHAGKVTLKVTAIDGREYYRSPATELLEGSYHFPIQISPPSGAYVVTLETGGEIKTIQVVKP